MYVNICYMYSDAVKCVVCWCCVSEVSEVETRHSRSLSMKANPNRPPPPTAPKPGSVKARSSQNVSNPGMIRLTMLSSTLSSLAKRDRPLEVR